MIDTDNLTLPSVMHGITATTEALELTMTADLLLGSLLRTLAAAKPGGRFLDLDTGPGMTAAWLLDGMTADSTLLGVDSDSEQSDFVRRFLGGDSRLELITGEPEQLLQSLAGRQARFDLIRATARQGEELLAAASSLLQAGGLLVVSGLMADDDRTAAGPDQVRAVIESLEANPGLPLTRLNWSSGLLLAARLAG
jgi:predicted O-methyltransferase YrrM